MLTVTEQTAKAALVGSLRALAGKDLARRRQ